jgi:hypothetical protein
MGVDSAVSIAYKALMTALSVSVEIIFESYQFQLKSFLNRTNAD